MAIDNTPPRLRLIVTIAVIVIITLLGLNFVFKSYFAIMTDEARREKLAPTTAKRRAARTPRQRRSRARKMPIDQAMAQLQGRALRGSSSRSPPTTSAPMTGWSKLPKQAPLPCAGGAHARRCR